MSYSVDNVWFYGKTFANTLDMNINLTLLYVFSYLSIHIVNIFKIPKFSYETYILFYIQ
jgi:hypothetical protein